MSETSQTDPIRGFYDRQAAENPRHAAVLGEPNDFATAYREHQEQRSLDALFPLDGSGRMIEFGCGGGRWLQALAPRVALAVGVEWSTRCVEICRQRVAGLENVHVHCADIRDFAVTGEFDLLYYSGVLLYLSDEALHSCLENHSRRLTDSGFVLIRDSLALHGTHWITHPQGYQAIYRSPESWHELMARHDFRLVTRRTANQRPLRNWARHSRILQMIHRGAQWWGAERLLLRTVANLFGYDQRTPVAGAEYSHDFMLYRRGH